MTSDQNTSVTGKQIKASAKAMLSDRGVLLKLIFCGFFYIAVIILFELFGGYAFSAIFYDVTEEYELQKYSLIFDTAYSALNLFLLYPLFVGLWYVAARLANGNSAEFVEIFEYYSSFKKIRKAWAVGAVIQLPLTFISLMQTTLLLISTDTMLLKALLPGINIIITVFYFFLAVFISGRLFPFVNSVVCGGDQPVSLCLKASLKATKGKMWKLFAFYLSFIPWILLSLLTVGVLFVIFTFPYMLIAECLYSEYLLTGKHRDHIKEETL